MEDYYVKGRIEGLEIAFAYAETTLAVNEIVLMQDCDPVAAHLLGRAITATVLGASLLPVSQRLNVNWKYPGALDTLAIEAGQDGTLRGIISPPHLHNKAKSTAEIFGDIGEIKTTIRGSDKILNASTTPVSLHDPVNDFAYHFSVSDQIETSIKAFIGFSSDEKNPITLSNGFMIQALPNCDLNMFERIRKRLDEKKASELIKKKENDHLLEEVIKAISSKEKDYISHNIGDKHEVKFGCNCVLEEKFSAILKSLSIPERMEIVKAKAPIKITCEFCKKKFQLSTDECIKYWNF